MNKSDIFEIKKNNTGTGLLIENDGYISMTEAHNKQIKEAFDSSDAWHCPYPFIVDAVFQKYGIKNANGRIYPENILRKQVDVYQQKINEKRALGECYLPDVLVKVKDGWKSLADIKEGDIVLTLNTTTNIKEYQAVIRKIEKDHDGSMIRIKGCGIDDLVTPGHEYPVYKNGKFQNFISAASLLSNSILDAKSSYIPNLLSNFNSGIKLFTPFINASSQTYNGKVMCIEVPNHTFYVQSNGFKHWTKNCNHPQESTIDLGRISHNIIELHWEGRTLVGKMELNVSKGFVDQGICSTLGDTVANLLLHGYKIGVSSRGVGSVEQKMGQYIVGDDFELICWDIVSDPSTPNAWIGSESELHTYVENKHTAKSNLSEKINKIKKIL